MKKWWGQHEWREPVGTWGEDTKAAYKDWVDETFGDHNPNNFFKYAEQYRAVKFVEASVEEPERYNFGWTDARGIYGNK